jgi:ribosomal protein S3
LGRKVNPIGFRLGIVHDWESKWYAERNYTEQLHEDLFIRRVISGELTRAGISRIEIERSANRIEVTIHTSKPGIVIGKQGANVERLRQMLEQQVGKKVHLKIEEIKVPETDARLIGESIAEQLSRRVAYRRAMKQAVMQAMRRGTIQGIKIKIVVMFGVRCGRFQQLQDIDSGFLREKPQDRHRFVDLLAPHHIDDQARFSRRNVYALYFRCHFHVRRLPGSRTPRASSAP